MQTKIHKISLLLRYIRQCYLVIISVGYFSIFQSLPLQAGINDEMNYPPRHFDQTEWERLSRELDYSKMIRKDRERLKNYTSGNGEKMSEKQESNKPSHRSVAVKWLSNPVVKIILIAIILLTISFFLYKVIDRDLLKRNKNKPVKTEDGDKGLSGDTPPGDQLEDLLLAAIKAKDFRFAIRIGYLILIRDLSLMKYIDWKRGKTNRQYLVEFSKHPESESFKELTHLYEWVWFGEYQPAEKQFEEWSIKCNTLLNNLKNSVDRTDDKYT